MNIKNPFWIYGSLVVAMIFWSLTFIWFKIANQVYPPFTIVFLRLVISTLVLLLISWFAGFLQKVKRKDYKWILLMSMFNPFFYFIGESLGLTMISSTLAAVIIATIPLLVPLGAYFILNERLNIINIIGMIISFTGVLIVLVKPGFSLAANPVGIGLMFMAVICAVGYTLVVKKLIFRYNAYSLTFYQNLIGIFLFMPLVMIFEWNVFLEADHEVRAIMSLIYLALFGSTAAFILYNYGIKQLGASKANIFTNIIPVLTAVFAYFVLREEMNWQKVTGIAIVLAGLLLSQLRKTNRTPHLTPTPPRN